MYDPQPRPLSAPVGGLPTEPDLAPEHKQAIIAALGWAWNELCAAEPQAVGEANEEKVSMMLERLLNERANGTRRARSLEDFDTVTRGSKVLTSDGRFEKQPDLHFRPPPYRDVQQASDWGWFVECKVVNGNASVEAYCVHGVGRFSSGEYAARTSSGGMVAYVRDGQRPYEALDPKLAGRFATVSHRRGLTADVSASRHRRDVLRPPCVEIELTHLWFQVA